MSNATAAKTAAEILAAEGPALEAAMEAVRTEETARLKGFAKDDLVSFAVSAKIYTRPSARRMTKGDLVASIADHLVTEDPAYTALDTLRANARKEQRIMDYAEATARTQRRDLALKALSENIANRVAGVPSYGLDEVVDLTARVAAAQVHATQWGYVAQVMETGKTPTEALDAVVSVAARSIIEGHAGTSSDPARALIYGTETKALSAFIREARTLSPVAASLLAY